MNKRSGFTLLEMLVVLIIIGTLAAFAYPQYHHVISQAKFSTLMPAVRAVINAQETYYARTGHYAHSQDILNVHFSRDPSKIDLIIGEEAEYAYVLGSHKEVPNTYYIMYQEHSPNFPSNIYCEAKTDDSNAMWICEEGWGGELAEHASLLGDGYTAFLLSGDPAAGWMATDYQGNPNVNLLHGDTCSTGQNGNCNHVTASDSSSCSSSGSNGGCNDSTFSDNSICRTTQGSGTGCTNSTFTNNSICDSQSEASCSGSSFDASSCHASGGKHACGDGSTFENNSTCYAYVGGGDRAHNSCGNSSYTRSSCVVDSTAASGYLCSHNDYDASTCYASKAGGCGGGSLYQNGSECYGLGTTSCDKSTFTGGSICHAEIKGSCSGSSAEPNTFDGATCYGNAENGCSTSIFKNNSVCHAKKKGACVGKNGNSSYQSGSYCTGEYCPAGSPKAGGGTWQACPDAGDTGKTC